VTWREDLRRVRITIDGQPKDLIGASFRGVAFLVDSVELSTGRRAVVHEFPLRNDPFVEDLGRRARKFRVDGYVIGDDYLTQKNALLDALEAEGPGALALPYYDIRRAIGETSHVRETKNDGGMAIFALEFCETPLQAPVPQIAIDPAGQVATAAASASTATQAEFSAAYSPAGLPAFALQSAETALTSAAAALSTRLSPLVADAQELASFNGQVTVLTAQAAALVRQPADLVGQFEAAIASLVTTAAAAPDAMIDALAEAYADDLGPLVVATTSIRARELANQIAITSALRSTMAIQAAGLAPTVSFDTIEDATATRDQVAALLDDQALVAGDTAYPALVDLRSKVMRAVPGLAVFARVVTISRHAPVPAFLLAYQLYGSVDREADIIARNRVRHPGFLIGDLKVLSNGG